MTNTIPDSLLSPFPIGNWAIRQFDKRNLSIWGGSIAAGMTFVYSSEFFKDKRYFNDWASRVPSPIVDPSSQQKTVGKVFVLALMAVAVCSIAPRIRPLFNHRSLNFRFEQVSDHCVTAFVALGNFIGTVYFFSTFQFEIKNTFPYLSLKTCTGKAVDLSKETPEVSIEAQKKRALQIARAAANVAIARKALKKSLREKPEVILPDDLWKGAIFPYSLSMEDYHFGGKACHHLFKTIALVCKTWRNLLYSQALTYHTISTHRVFYSKYQIAMKLVYSFLRLFCEENDAGERQQICSSVTREIMLYPANLKMCAKPHFYELATLHELLIQGHGHANCLVCQIPFQAKDIEINTEAHDRLEEVVKEAFAYLLLSIQDPDHLILQKGLEKNRERLMSHLWSQTFKPLPTLLSDDVAQRIRRKEPLPIDVVWTLYPAFSQVCAQFLQDSKIMLEGFINDLEAQGEIKTNSEGQDSAEITQEQHGKRLIQIMRLKNKNDEIFNFAATIKTKN